MGCGAAGMLRVRQCVGLGQAEELQQSRKPPVPFGVETGHELLGCGQIYNTANVALGTVVGCVLKTG